MGLSFSEWALVATIAAVVLTPTEWQKLTKQITHWIKKSKQWINSI